MLHWESPVGSSRDLRFESSPLKKEEKDADKKAIIAGNSIRLERIPDERNDTAGP